MMQEIGNNLKSTMADGSRVIVGTDAHGRRKFRSVKAFWAQFDRRGEGHK
jgi:hypothetical protein